MKEYYRASPFGLSFEGTAGLLLNVRPRLAVGGGVRLGTGDMGNSHPEWSALARGRLWLDERYVVDVQGGAVKHSPGVQFHGPYVWGHTFSARLAHAAWAFIGLRFDLVDVPPVEVAVDVQETLIIKDPGGTHSALLLEAGVSGPLAVLASALWLFVSQIEISFH